MTSAVPPSTRKDRAAQARTRYHYSRLQRLAERKADLALPEVPSIIDPADGTLHKDALKADLQVVIQEWDVPVYDGDTDTVQLQLSMGDDNFAAVGPALGITAPVAPGTFPLTLSVPRVNLAPDGLRKLRYHILRYNDLDNYSPAIDLICDSTPPWEDITPEAAVLPSVAVTDDYLAANPDGVTATLPAYSTRAPGDKVAYYYLNVLPSDPALLPPPLAYIDVPANLKIVLPAASIRAVGDGGCYVCYVLVDKAGNESKLSYYSTLNVALGPLPSGLQAPVVPLASDGLIDLEDARTGVVVQIPAFANWKSTDQIVLEWGSTTLPAEQVGSSPSFPFPVSIPTEILKQAYGNASGEVPLDTRYTVMRGTVPFGPESATVNVDFSVIGSVRPTPDPDWPDPVNPALAAAEVRGKTSGIANRLERKDAGQDATLTFQLYTPANDGELVDFYWGDTQVSEASYTVNVQDGPQISVDIPWQYILDAGNNPALPVHYRIRAADSSNEQYAVTTLVAVDAITITPDAPTFQGTTSRGWLNCNSLWEDPASPTGVAAFRVDVPDLSTYLKDGDTVTLTWTPLRDRAGEDVISAAVKTEDVTLGTDNPVTGFTWRVQPYVDHILPVFDRAKPDGRGRVHYAFMYNGEKITSETLEAVVSLGTGSGTCVIP